MKIAITSSGPELTSQVDPRFGRCAYFIFVDTDSDKFEAIENSGAQGMGGVGIQAGQMMIDKGIKAVLTGNCGPNAFQTLKAAGVEVITGVSGTVQEVVDKFKAGGFQSVSGPNVSPHSGIEKKE
ncbi:MAG: NifB/NifX family molybdenum-iron cluster-binding protein [Atribacterota bacterium]|nr:NifB/NifX family molybdenum-iron cluster-binding protein [Atribacterota bacterium]